MEKLSRRVITGVTLSVLALLALGRGTSYDNDVHPSVGIVTHIAEPERVCTFNGKFTTCSWEYWVYVDGCQQLSPEAIAIAKKQDSDWTPEQGWVDVSGDTYSSVQIGQEINFRERNLLNSIQIAHHSLSGSDNAKACYR